MATAAWLAYSACSAPVDGHVKAPEAPGIGAEIKPELFKSGDAIVKTIAGV